MSRPHPGDMTTPLRVPRAWSSRPDVALVPGDGSKVGDVEMADIRDEVALIVGAGDGLSASIARKLAARGGRVVLAARNADKLASLAESISALALRCDASRHEDVTRMFTEVSDALGPPGIVVYNASGRTRGPVADLDPAEVERTLAATAFGGFLVGQQAARSCWRAGPASSCSRARRRASRALLNPHRSRWGSSLCGAWRREWPESSAPGESTSPTSSWTARSAARAITNRPTRRIPPRSGRDRRHVSVPHGSAPERMDA